MPEWEELRSAGLAIKEHTLTHLADYLEEFERNATKQRRARPLGARRRRAQPDRLRHPERARRVHADQEQVDAADECGMTPVPREARDRGHRVGPRRAHPAARRRAAEPHRRAGDPQAPDRRGARLSPRRSAPTRRTPTSHYLAEASASTRGRDFLRADAGHDRRQLRRRRDGRRSSSAPTRATPTSASACRQLYIACIGIEKIIPAHRASRGLHPHAVAKRPGLADHAVHLALPRPARRRARCTSSWSTTAARDRLGHGRTSGTR